MDGLEGRTALLCPLALCTRWWIIRGSMTAQLPDNWKSAIFELLEKGGTVIALGVPDVGKTTFCLALADACAARKVRCAIVDSDTGQSEIGPPGTVGWARVERPVTALSELKPEDIYFVGNTSPPGHMLQTVVGIARMVECARRWQPHLTIVDMPGFVIGPSARDLVESAIAVTSAENVLAIQRASELQPILTAVRSMDQPGAIALAASPFARRRSSSERASRRRMKFAAYFAEAPVFQISGRDVGISRSELFSGAPLPPNEQSYLQRVLGASLVYAEDLGPRVLVVLRGAGMGAGKSLAVDSLPGKEILALPEQSLRNVLVGLADSHGRHMAMGILENVDFRSERLDIRAPLRQSGAVRQVIFGALRVRADGVEVGRAGVPPELQRPLMQIDRG